MHECIAGFCEFLEVEVGEFDGGGFCKFEYLVGLFRTYDSGEDVFLGEDPGEGYVDGLGIDFFGNGFYDVVYFEGVGVEGF